MAYNKITQCVICIEGQRKEDNFRIRQIEKRVYYLTLHQDGGEDYGVEEEDRNIFICDRCHFWEARANDFSGVAPMAWTIMHAKEWTARKEAGLTEFIGSLFFPDGGVNIPKFKEVQDQSSRLRTLNNRGITIQMKDIIRWGYYQMKPADNHTSGNSTKNTEKTTKGKKKKTVISSSATVATSGKRVPATSRELQRSLGSSSTRKNGQLARRLALQSSTGAFSFPTVV
jgi:hypothetical protein